MPRLRIEASNYDFNDWNGVQDFSPWFTAFCDLLEMSMLFVFATTRFRRASLEEVRLRIFNSDAPIGPVQPANLKSGCTIPWLLIAKPGALTAPLVGIDSLRRVYLNYRQTTWEELRRDLEGALRGLPAQVVYLDGDNDILFMDAAQALDTIQGLGARAIL